MTCAAGLVLSSATAAAAACRLQLLSSHLQGGCIAHCFMLVPCLLYLLCSCTSNHLPTHLHLLALHHAFLHPYVLMQVLRGRAAIINHLPNELQLPHLMLFTIFSMQVLRG
jgi:hypothetical protein